MSEIIRLITLPSWALSLVVALPGDLIIVFLQRTDFKQMLVGIILKLYLVLLVHLSCVKKHTNCV